MSEAVPDEETSQVAADPRPTPSDPFLFAEEIFVSSGPSVFRFLLDTVGNRSEAVRVMDVGAATLSRWINSVPGDVFGPRKDVKTWRSVWFGYPSPLPGFDRIVEGTEGRGKSWLSVRCSAVGMEEALATARRDGLVLETVVGQEAVAEACRRMKVPSTTRWRWVRPVPWPYQWLVLDRLSMNVSGMGWPELVLSYRSDDAPRKVPIAGLARLTGDVVPHIRNKTKRMR